ncbi:MAG: anti-sigma factor domain-containing protein [Bacillota bacterium]|nr:anti-sigma factor domain-containing protein [Bacillota bacterium]
MNIRKRRGVVLELTQEDMVLLTPEGEFIRRPVLNGAVSIGQEVHYTENAEVVAPPKERFFNKWRRSGLAVAAVLLLLILTPAMLNQMPIASETVAYVTVDVNPSIELGIDNKDMVSTALGLNDDGEKVVNSLQLEGINSEKAVELITKKILEMGIIKKDEYTKVMITVRPVKAGNKVAVELEQKLAFTTKNVLAQDEVRFAVVSTALIDEELRVSAQVAGVSPGKYLMMLEENNNIDNINIAALDEITAEGSPNVSNDDTKPTNEVPVPEPDKEEKQDTDKVQIALEPSANSTTLVEPAKPNTETASSKEQAEPVNKEEAPETKDPLIEIAWVDLSKLGIDPAKLGIDLEKLKDLTEEELKQLIESINQPQEGDLQEPALNNEIELNENLEKK